MKTKMLIMILVILSQGCTTFSTSSEDYILQGFITIGVVKVIENQRDRQKTKERIIEIVREVKKLIDKESKADPEAIARFIKMKVQWEKLTVDQNILLSMTIDHAVTQIKFAVAENKLPADQLLRVKEILDMIIRAAESYQAPKIARKMEMPA